MQRKLITIFATLTAILVVGFVGVRWGGRYVAENVLLPRIARRLDVQLRWDDISTRLGSATMTNLQIVFPEISEVHAAVEEITVTYNLWALLRGEVDIEGVAIRRPVGRLARFDQELEARLLERARRTLDAARGGAGIGRGSGAFPEISLDDGTFEVRRAFGADYHVESVRARFDWDGRFEASSGRWDVVVPGVERPILQGSEVSLTGLRQRGRRFAIDAVTVSGLQLEWALGGEEENPLVGVIRDLRRQLGSAERASSAAARSRATRGRGASSLDAGPSRGGSAGDGGSRASDGGVVAARRPPAGAGSTTARDDVGLALELPSDVTLESSRIVLLLPEQVGHDERSRRVTLEAVEGRVFLGGYEEPPSAELTGRLEPGGGGFQLEASVGDEAALRGRLRVSSLHVGRLAAGMSVSGLTFDEGSVLDADLSVERRHDGRIAFRGRASTEGISFGNRLVASEPITGLRLRGTAHGVFDWPGRTLTLERARLAINGVEVSTSGHLTRLGERLAFDLNVELHPVHCAVLLDATPEALRDRLDDLSLDGVISGRLHFALDTENLRDLALEVDLNNECRAVGRGRLAIGRLQGAFTHRVELPNDEVYEFRTGPGSGNWASLDQISPYLIAAVLTTEDGRFFQHNGFNLREIRRAIARDVEAGRPRFGASTISMQLARNLYLYRRRTLARKLQEAVLTWYLEQNLTKEQILTLYLNIIEFGPEIYGVRHATMHYFGRQPDDLSPREAMFLAKLLPSPVRSHEQTYEAGELGPRWRARVDRALRVMRDRRALSNEEYREALEQRIVFYREGDPLPVHRTWRPRAPFLHHRGIVDDAPPERWLEVETEANIPAPPELLDDY